MKKRNISGGERKYESMAKVKIMKENISDAKWRKRIRRNVEENGNR